MFCQRVCNMRSVKSNLPAENYNTFSNSGQNVKAVRGFWWFLCCRVPVIIGMREQPNEQFLQYRTLRNSGVISYLFNTLGRYSEIQRPDRDQYIYINFRNVKEGTSVKWKSMFNTIILCCMKLMCVISVCKLLLWNEGVRQIFLISLLIQN